MLKLQSPCNSKKKKRKLDYARRVASRSSALCNMLSFVQHAVYSADLVVDTTDRQPGN